MAIYKKKKKMNVLLLTHFKLKVVFSAMNDFLFCCCLDALMCMYSQTTIYWNKGGGGGSAVSYNKFVGYSNLIKSKNSLHY